MTPKKIAITNKTRNVISVGPIDKGTVTSMIVWNMADEFAANVQTLFVIPPSSK